MSQLAARCHAVRRNLIAVIGFSLAFYFCYHVVAGDRSYLRLMALERRIAAEGAAYDREHAGRLALEQKVAMLRPGSIDRDLLEERARAVLGYGYEDERIILEQH